MKTGKEHLTKEWLNLPEDQIYLRFLIRWIETAKEKIWGEELPVPVSPEGRTGASFLLYQRLCTLAGTALDALWRKKLAGKNPLTRMDLRLARKDERRQAAVELLKELEEMDGSLLWAEAPLLSGQLDRCMNQFCIVFREMLERIGTDREEIYRSFFDGEDFGTITGWNTQMADLHFHGRSTVRVDTEKGRFFYKPRDCRTDVLFGKIVERWFFDITRVLHCILRPGYVFCQNMEPLQVSTEAEAEQYFWNLGGFCALFQMMGASDLHSENLIIQGVYPVLVDMETVLTPQPEEFSDPEIFPEPPARKQDFVYDLNHSLYPSSILPKFDGGRQFSILLDKRSETHQLPVIDGKKRTVLEFQDSFLDGFSQIYDRCICCREELMAVFHEFEQVPVRRLLRQSAYYGRVLEALQNPAALRSEESRRKITGWLNQYFQKHGAEHLLSIVLAEENSLLESGTAVPGPSVLRKPCRS